MHGCVYPVFSSAVTKHDILVPVCLWPSFSQTYKTWKGKLFVSTLSKLLVAAWIKCLLSPLGTKTSARSFNDKPSKIMKPSPLIDVKEGPVGSRHRAAVPATATKKAPNLCRARSWSHEENKPVLPMTRTSSRTMIHLATFTLASYSVASLDLKLRSVFEQLNFESAPHISFKKKIDSFSLFSLFAVRSAGVILFAARLFKRNESTSIISRRLRRSSCTKALNPGIARPTMVTWEFQASNFATAYFEKRVG